eukprot:jgi/Bigna1/87542/estExt_fgenesh1_pg.C_210153
MALMWAICLPLLLGSHALQNAPKTAIPVVENDADIQIRGFMWSHIVIDVHQASEVQSLLSLQTERYPPHHRRSAEYDAYDLATPTFEEEQDVPVYGRRRSHRRREADDLYAETYDRPQSGYQSESLGPGYDSELAAVHHRQHTKQVEREMQIDSLKIELGRQKLKTKRALEKAHVYEMDSIEAKKNEKDTIRHTVRLERALKHEQKKEAKLRSALKTQSRALQREKEEERNLEARLKQDEKKIDALLKDISETKEVSSKAAPQSVEKAQPAKKDTLLDSDDEEKGDIAVLAKSKQNEDAQTSDKAALATTSESSTKPISPLAPIDNSWYGSSPNGNAVYTTLYIVLAIAGASCILGAFASCCCIHIQKKKLLR